MRRLSLLVPAVIALLAACGEGAVSGGDKDAASVSADSAVAPSDAAQVPGKDAAQEPADAAEPGPDASAVRADAAEPDASMQPGLDAALAGADAAQPGADAGSSQPDAATQSPDAAIVYPPMTDRPMGVNMPNLLHEYLGRAPGGPDDARAQLDAARAQGFTHARIIASGYWPTDMSTGKGWLADKAAYFAAFDQLVSDARSRGIRLVPSLLFQIALFPDLAGEPIGKLFTKGSAARALAEQYVTEVVSRYRGGDAVLFWELGNELNLMADLDFSGCDVCAGGPNNACGSLAPSLGTPCRRTAADSFFSCNACRGVSSAQEDLGEFTASMAALVKSLDPSRPFATGNAYPRPSAWHLAAHPCPACDWTVDSPAEFAQALAQLHPAGVDLVTVHHYPGSDAARFGSLDDHGIALLATAQAAVAAMGKQLYVGEYGEPRAGSTSCGGTEVCGGDPDRGMTRRLLDAMVEQGVAWSALWAFEFFQFCPTVPTCHTVTASEPIAAAIGVHDSAYGSCVGRSDGTACPIGLCQGQVCAPVHAGAWRFDAAGDEGPWLVWTNCSACAPGTLQRVSNARGGALRLTSFDLPCTGSCQYPGVYALGPAVAVPSATLAHALVRTTGRSTSPAATVRLLAQDGAGNDLGQASGSQPLGASDGSRAFLAPLPPGTAQVRVRLEVAEPSSTLEVDEVSVDLEP